MAQPVPEPAEVVKELRSKVLALSPSDLGIAPTTQHPRVWGVLMEMGLPEGLATLVALGDGTVSLYLGHGGSAIGGGAHAHVRQTAESMLTLAEQHLDQLAPAHAYPLPEVGRVKFYVLTFSGTLAADADEDDVGERKHTLSPLFYAGQDVITESRQVSEQK